MAGEASVVAEVVERLRLIVRDRHPSRRCRGRVGEPPGDALVALHVTGARSRCGERRRVQDRPGHPCGYRQPVAAGEPLLGSSALLRTGPSPLD